MGIDALPHGLGGLAAVVLLLGMKHGFDADHLATIDGLTRAGTPAHPRWARACGALFSLGHGMVVVLVALAVSHAATTWQVPGWLNAFGAWVSISFLALLGLMNVMSVLLTPAHEMVTLKGLRHTHATILMELGVPPTVVRECLGHSTITTAMNTSSDVTPTDDEEEHRRPVRKPPRPEREHRFGR